MCVDARIKRLGELEEEYVEDESQGEEEVASMRQRLLRCLLQESKN